MPLIFVSFNKINLCVSSQFKVNSSSCAVGNFQYCHYGDCYYRLWLTKNMRGLWGWIELFAGMGGDGSESVQERVEMGVEVCGDGWGRD